MPWLFFIISLARDIGKYCVAGNNTFGADQKVNVPQWWWYVEILSICKPLYLSEDHICWGSDTRWILHPWNKPNIEICNNNWYKFCCGAYFCVNKLLIFKWKKLILTQIYRSLSEMIIKNKKQPKFALTL